MPMWTAGLVGRLPPRRALGSCGARTERRNVGLADDFEEMIAAGFGVDGAEQVECVFVDMTGGHGAHLGMRVSALVNLLSSGADWDHVGEQTGFAPTWRPSTASGEAARGIGVE